MEKPIFRISVPSAMLTYNCKKNDGRCRGWAAEKSESAPRPKRKSDTVPKKLKFSFKEQREFETIDDDIAALEQQLVEVKQQMEEFCRE